MAFCGTASTACDVRDSVEIHNFCYFVGAQRIGCPLPCKTSAWSIPVQLAYLMTCNFVLVWGRNLHAIQPSLSDLKLTMLCCCPNQLLSAAKKPFLEKFWARPVKIMRNQIKPVETYFFFSDKCLEMGCIATQPSNTCMHDPLEGKHIRTKELIHVFTVWLIMWT